MPAARVDGSRPNLASVLQEGRKNANIHASSGVIWRIPVIVGKCIKCWKHRWRSVFSSSFSSSYLSSYGGRRNQKVGGVLAPLRSRARAVAHRCRSFVSQLTKKRCYGAVGHAQIAAARSTSTVASAKPHEASFRERGRLNPISSIRHDNFDIVRRF